MTEPARGDGPPAGPSSETPLLDWLHRVEERVHERSLALLHLTPGEREEQVHLMLANRQRGTVEYWTFLMLSMAIATLGLAMDSTTVVIGAMLVSPLMGPIVEFAMGLVVGSPVLTVRSVLRIVGSVVVVVVGAALMTMLLPFHEVTGEIAARTEPTLMDLALAGFVALAATLTVVKARSETNIVAAGAAIGIALVPPVCVVGFGLGIADAEIAGGAFLLLVTNFTAIISVGVVFFYLLGYERVSVQVWDEEALAAAPPGGYLHRVLLGADRVFGGRRSRLFRVLVPTLVFGMLAFPLSRALDRVSWEVRARSAVRSILADLPAEHDFVETTSRIANGQVSVRTHVVGETVAGSDSLQAALATRIAAATGVEPDVRVIALPNYGALRRVEPPPSRSDADAGAPDVALARIRQELATALDRAWPADAYGALVGWRIELTEEGEVDLRVQHMGTVPDAGAERLLVTALGSAAPAGLRVRFASVDTTAVVAEPVDAPAWLPELSRTVEAARAARRTHVCVELPAPAALEASGEAATVARLVPGLLAALPLSRYSVRSDGERFAVRLRPEGGRTTGGVAAPEGGLPSSDGAAASDAEALSGTTASLRSEGHDASSTRNATGRADPTGADGGRSTGDVTPVGTASTTEAAPGPCG